MSESIKKRIDKTIKTTAALFAVVFLLLCLSGCRNWKGFAPAGGHNGGDLSPAGESGHNVPGRRHRRRAADYSRLPSNMPASWQIQSAGY